MFPVYGNPANHVNLCYLLGMYSDSSKWSQFKLSKVIWNMYVWIILCNSKPNARAISIEFDDVVVIHEATKESNKMQDFFFCWYFAILMNACMNCLGLNNSKFDCFIEMIAWIAFEIPEKSNEPHHMHRYLPKIKCTISKMCRNSGCKPISFDAKMITHANKWHPQMVYIYIPYTQHAQRMLSAFPLILVDIWCLCTKSHMFSFHYLMSSLFRLRQKLTNFRWVFAIISVVNYWNVASWRSVI